MDRARPPLISIAQILAVSGKSQPTSALSHQIIFSERCGVLDVRGALISWPLI